MYRTYGKVTARRPSDSRKLHMKQETLGLNRNSALKKRHVGIRTSFKVYQLILKYVS